MKFIDRIKNLLSDRKEDYKFSSDLEKTASNPLQGDSHHLVFFRYVIGRDPTIDEIQSMTTIEYMLIEKPALTHPSEETILTNVLGRQLTDLEKFRLKTAIQIVDVNNAWLTRDRNLSTRNQMDGGSSR
jgi:hypothetical protein